MALPAFCRRTHLERTRSEAVVFTAATLALGLATLGAVAWAAGFDHVAAILRGVDPIWFLVALGAEAVAYLGYVVAYREVSRVERGPEMAAGDAVAAVAAGFGPFVARGGFAVDASAFRLAGVRDEDVRVRVFGLGALEYAILAPAACATAIVLLLEGVHRPSYALTLPWAIAVPIGFAAALWAVEHRHRFAPDTLLGQALRSIYVLKCLFVQPRHLVGPLGTAVYWFGDIVCLWACLQAFTRGTPDVGLLLIGYATGYALSRRTLPLAGAGAVEALLPFALSWCGISLAAAVLAVFSYRVFNLWLPAVPAAFGLRRLRSSPTAS